MRTSPVAVDHHPAACYFEVPGPFATKGSTVSFKDRRGVVRTKTDSKHERKFTAAVQWAATVARLAKIPKGQGVSVAVVYEWPRPAKCERDRTTPCVRPDVDKLARALLDALTGLAYDDDGQVVVLSVRKRYGPRTVAKVMVMGDRG